MIIKRLKDCAYIGKMYILRLLERVSSSNPQLAKLMDFINPTMQNMIFIIQKKYELFFEGEY